MARKKKNEQLLADYFEEWVDTYKVGAVRDVTIKKYRMTNRELRRIAPNLKISQLDRRVYQRILNEYALTHEKVTAMDFHHQVKGCILDLFHEGQIERDPTYKAVVKGKAPSEKKRKWLNVDECKRLISALDFSQEINMDWFIVIALKTGLRFSELLALTPNDFDFTTNTLTVNKTWSYKNSGGGFDLTKNKSSIRKIAIDWQIVGQFAPVIRNLPPDEPIFIEKYENGHYKRIFNSTINYFLKRKCEDAGVTIITVHALRHTHASILLNAGVTIHSIADRLGHSSVSTTQETYTHIIDELASKDNQVMIGALTAIG